MKQVAQLLRMQQAVMDPGVPRRMILALALALALAMRMDHLKVILKILLTHQLQKVMHLPSHRTQRVGPLLKRAAPPPQKMIHRPTKQPPPLL